MPLLLLSKSQPLALGCALGLDGDRKAAVLYVVMLQNPLGTVPVPRGFCWGDGGRGQLIGRGEFFVGAGRLDS